MKILFLITEYWLEIPLEMEFQDVFIFVLVLRQDRAVDGDR